MEGKNGRGLGIRQVSSVLNKSSVTQHFEHGDAFEICLQQNNLGFPHATITSMTTMFVATKTEMIDALRKGGLTIMKWYLCLLC